MQVGGTGTGSVWVFVILFFLGWDLKRGTRRTKVYNFIMNNNLSRCKKNYYYYYY